MTPEQADHIADAHVVPDPDDSEVRRLDDAADPTDVISLPDPRLAVAGALIFGQIMAAATIPDAEEDVIRRILANTGAMLHIAIDDPDVPMPITLESVFCVAAEVVHGVTESPDGASDPATAHEYIPTLVMGQLHADGTVTRVDPADVDTRSRWGHMHVVGGRILGAVGRRDRAMLHGILDGEYAGMDSVAGTSFTMGVLWTMARSWHALMSGAVFPPAAEGASVEVPDVPPADWSGHTPQASPEGPEPDTAQDGV